MYNKTELKELKKATQHHMKLRKVKSKELLMVLSFSPCLERADKRGFVAERGRNGERGIQAAEQRAENEDLPDAHVDRQLRQVVAQRGQAGLRVKRSYILNDR